MVMKEEIMKVYVLTTDGYCESYGAELFLTGVYLTKEEAEKAVKTLPEEIRDISKITEAELGKTYGFIKTDDGCNYDNPNYLGGYIE